MERKICEQRFTPSGRVSVQVEFVEAVRKMLDQLKTGTWSYYDFAKIETMLDQMKNE